MKFFSKSASSSMSKFESSVIIFFQENTANFFFVILKVQSGLPGLLHALIFLMDFIPS